jgi:hypothetical protein
MFFPGSGFFLDEGYDRERCSEQKPGRQQPDSDHCKYPVTSLDRS